MSSFVSMDVSASSITLSAHLPGLLFANAHLAAGKYGSVSSVTSSVTVNTPLMSVFLTLVVFIPPNAS